VFGAFDGSGTGAGAYMLHYVRTNGRISERNGLHQGKNSTRLLLATHVRGDTSEWCLVQCLVVVHLYSTWSQLGAQPIGPVWLSNLNLPPMAVDYVQLKWLSTECCKVEQQTRQKADASLKVPKDATQRRCVYTLGTRTHIGKSTE